MLFSFPDLHATSFILYMPWAAWPSKDIFSNMNAIEEVHQRQSTCPTRSCRSIPKMMNAVNEGLQVAN